MIEEPGDMLLKTIEQLREENRLLKEELQQSKACKIDGSKKYCDHHHLVTQLFKAMPDMVAIFDYEGHVLDVIANNHSGIPTEELVGKHLSYVLKEESHQLIAPLQEAKKTGEIALGFHPLTVNGETFYYEDRVLPLDENRALCVFHDITIRHQHKQEIDELNMVLSAIIENLPVYLFVKEIHNGMKYAYWNRLFAESSGIPPEKVIGHTDIDFFPNKDDARQFMEDDRQLIESGKGEVEFIEDYVAVSGEKRIVQTRKLVTPVLPGGKQLLIGTSIDITKLKKVERELEEAKAEAERNDQSKSQFLSNMGHEIRTPVNAIVGFSNLLAEVQDEAEREQYVHIIEANSSLLLKLIDDILDISRIEAGKLQLSRQELSMNRLCENLYMMHGKNASEGVSFVYDIPSEEVVLHNDPNRIMQVLTNFLTNACKFTCRGEIHFGFKESEEGMIYVYVTDTGTGIPEDRLAKVFDRFVRLDHETSGTGLGLAICKMIIEHMGGQIGVTSTHGEGSTFFFTIPRN